MAGLLNLIKQKLGYTAPQQNVFGSRVNPEIQRKFYAQQEDPRQAFRSELNPKKVAERALVKARRSVDPEKRAKLVDIARKVGQTQIPDLGQMGRDYFAPTSNLRARDVVREIGQTVSGFLNNPTLESKLKDQGVNPTLASFMSNYGGSAGTIKKSGKKVVDKVTGKLITLPEAKTPRVTETQGRAQLTGKAAETPSLTLDQRAQGFADAMGAGKKKPVVPELTADDAKFSTSVAHGMAEDRQGFNQIFDRWIAKGEVAKTTGTQRAMQNAVPSNVAQQTVKDIESGAASKYGSDIRRAYDDLYQQAKKLGKETGQDVAYRENYLTHVWQDSPEKIQQVMKRVGKKFGYANAREIPTYEEGIKLGLTPRFQNPGQMVGEYARKLEQTKANVDFFKELKDNGYIVPASVGHREPGFVPVTAEGFPLNTTSIDGDMVTGQWFAPKDVADQINKVFNPPAGGKIDKTFDIGAKVSSKAQDILLSGGIPKTPINAFTVAQVTKEVLGGRVKSPITSIIKSLDGNASQKFFQDNVETIKKMQERNIPFSSEFNIDDVVDRGWVQNIFGKNFGELWTKTVNAPTFKRFMPMLQVNLFNDIERAAIRGGKSAVEASDIAAAAVRNFYGLGSTGKAARASKLGKDVVSTTLFAPRYRESMFNFWVNNVKALAKNPLKLENRTNATFMVGATAMLIGMNEANKAINGHSMMENPDGKTDKLLIPLGNGKTLGIPFLSSIATLPRMGFNTGKAVVEGNFKEAGKQLRSNLSVGLRPLTDVLSNENYFGSEIYDENDTLGGKVKAGANYLLNPVTGAYTHPYLREGTKFAQGKQGVAETLSKATELPIRWYNTKSIENAPFWKEYENQKKAKDITEKAKYGKISQEAAEKQLAKLGGKNNVADGKIIEGDSYVAYKTSAGIKFADTKQEAELEIAKDKFKRGDKNFEEYGDSVFRKNKNGDVTVQPKLEFEEQLSTALLTKFKKEGDYAKWRETAEMRGRQLQELIQDPSIDELERIKLENEFATLEESYAKYKNYGGKFKKGKKGKKAKIVKASGDVTTASQLIKFARPSAPKAKKIALNSPRVKLASLKAPKPQSSKITPVSGRRIKIKK